MLRCLGAMSTIRNASASLLFPQDDGVMRREERAIIYLSIGTAEPSRLQRFLVYIVDPRDRVPQRYI